jgi:hypothetical protein
MNPKRQIYLLMFFASLIIIGNTPADCVYPGDEKLVTEANKMNCFKGATFLLPQPDLTNEQLIQFLDNGYYNGDDSWRNFSKDKSVTCVYRPHYAFKAKAGFDTGNSPKIRCATLIAGPDGKLNTLVDEEFPQENKTWLLSDISIDPDGKFVKTSDGKKIDMDEYKVKFTTGNVPPNHNKRHNEVATEVFVSRLYWTLGIPADYMFVVKDATALGGNEDWKGLRKWITSSSGPAPFTYRFAAIERDPPFKTIEMDDKNEQDFWKLSWAKQNITSNTWSNDQVVQFDTMRLAWSLVNFFNLNSGSLRKQTRLSCSSYTKTPEKNIQCAQVIAYVQDVGSSMGGDGLFVNPRGILKKYQKHKIFKNLNTCEVSVRFEDHAAKVKKDAVLLLNDRLEKVAPLNNQAFIKSLVEYSRLALMDPDSTVDGWVSAFYSMRKEINDQATLIKNHNDQCL